MRRVIVHIDRLVLKGFRHEDRVTIAEGLRNELSRLYRDDPDAVKGLTSPACLRDTPRLKLNDLSIPPSAGPEQVGTQLGHQIAASLTPG